MCTGVARPVNIAILAGTAREASGLPLIVLVFPPCTALARVAVAAEIGLIVPRWTRLAVEGARQSIRQRRLLQDPGACVIGIRSLQLGKELLRAGEVERL